MNRFRLLLSFLLLAVTLSLIASPAQAVPDPTAVKINEFSSNSPDFVELINTGAETVDLSGWVLKDNTENNSYTFPSGSSIAAGAILGLSGEDVDFAFGLGNGDAVRLFAPGAVLIDSHTYPAHPPAGQSWGRCPDGTGAIVVTAAATKGAPNTCAVPPTAVKINEFSSNSPDFIELINTGTGPVDLTGWVLKDNIGEQLLHVPGRQQHRRGRDQGTQRRGRGLRVRPRRRRLGAAVRARRGADRLLHVPGAPAGRQELRALPRRHRRLRDHGRRHQGRRQLTARFRPAPRTSRSTRSSRTRIDLVELTNIGATPVDISGYRLKDNDDTHVFAIAAGTTLAAHGYLVVDVNPSLRPGQG